MMDEWAHGWTGGWVDKWWLYVLVDRGIDGSMSEYMMDRRMDRWMDDGLVGRWMGRHIDRWVDGREMIVWTGRGISGRMSEYLYKYFVPLESICFLSLFPYTGHLLKVSPSHHTWQSSALPAANCSKAFYAFVLAQKAFHQKTETRASQKAYHVAFSFNDRTS